VKRKREKEKERVRRDRQSPRRRRRRRRGACVRACVRVRAADHPVLRRTRRRRIADVRHDDGDPGLRGGAVQHILGARRADMLLRGLPLYHEVRKAALYDLYESLASRVILSFFPSICPSVSCRFVGRSAILRAYASFANSICRYVQCVRINAARDNSDESRRFALSRGSQSLE